MLFKEMRSAFLSTLRELKMEASLFDFAESIDAAIMFFALNLPKDSLPDLVKVYNADPSPFDSRVLTMPSDLLKIESAQIAKSRNSSDEPIYIPATIVGQRQFLNAVQYSSEPLISVFNGMINYNPEVASIVADAPGAINLVYRARPNTYITKFNRHAIGSCVSRLDQISGQLNSFTTESIGQTWADIGMSTEMLVGGAVVIPNGSNVYIGEIAYAWDDTGFGGLTVSGNCQMPFISTGFALSCYVTQIPDLITSSRYNNDTESTNISEVFHALLVDYALGRFLMSRKPEVAKGFMQNVYQVFQALGVNMKNEYGGEEE